VDEYKFYTPIAVLNDDRIVSCSNKQFSFLPDIYGHYLGYTYATTLKGTYINMLTDENITYIEEPVFQFIDYEAISGTGHSYDIMFYLLYHFQRSNIKAKLLVCNSTNKYYNTTLNLIKKYYNIEYLYIDPYQTYVFTTYYCIQTYQNVFFHYIKEFINQTLIDPIIKYFEESKEPYFSNVCKIKYCNTNNINIDGTFERSVIFDSFCTKYNCKDLELVDEEYKIYLINKCNTMIITAGSSYYINVLYYIKDSSNKYITILCHAKYPQIALDCIVPYENKLRSRMSPHSCGNITDQVYGTFTFSGDISIIDSLDTWINTTKLFKYYDFVNYPFNVKEIVEKFRLT
jgi:hypothetical protein